MEKAEREKERKTKKKMEIERGEKKMEIERGEKEDGNRER
jgi:hypothetical protein